MAIAYGLRCPLSECKSVTLTAGTDLTAYEPLKVEDTVYFPLVDVDSGDEYTAIYYAPKVVLPCAEAATAGYAVGEKVYSNVSGGYVTEEDSGNTLCGIVTAASVVGDKYLEVHFDGTLGIVS